ncbi:MAG: CSLREA domain-containing protein, partial [Anaerolineales bacterium]|nr:CSLREA domain-containing protein [Anaerolineales bacterium]
MKSRWSKWLVITLLAGMLTILLAFPITTRAGGGVFVVNTVDDADDGTCDASHCSLREAINTVNTNPGTQYIYFDIPGPGPHVISLCSMLPPLTDGGTLIDGTTEPDYAGGYPSVVIRPGAFSLAAYPPCNPPPVGIWIQASDITVRGLSIIGFMNPTSSLAAGIVMHMGSNVTIEQNFIGMDPAGTPVGNRDGIIVGSEAAWIDSNRISGNVFGIKVFRNDHVIRSNFLGTDPTGLFSSAALANHTAILLEEPSTNVQVGGSTPAWMNLISGNTVGIEIRSDANFVFGNRIGLDANGTGALGNDTGIWVVGDQNVIEGNTISDSTTGVLLLGHENQVSGNFIGTDKTGDVAVGNDEGIHINGDDNIIGGGIPIAVPPGVSSGNIISGNNTGIFLAPQADGNQIFGNKIGAANSADTGLPNQIGILLDGASFNVIGSTSLPHEANWIMYNLQEGIRFITTASNNLVTGNYIAFNDVGISAGATTGDAVENTFSHNHIYTNAQLGIDLVPWGVTPNDPGDADFGPNYLQNFPEISSASTTSVQGTACLGCIVEIFESDLDPSDHGEGISPVGEGVTDASGNFDIAIDPIATVNNCDKVTATATDSNGNTSEFALNVLVNPCLVLGIAPILFVGVIFLAGGGALGGLIGRGRHIPLNLAVVGGAVIGGVVGVSLLAVSTKLPFVKPGLPEEIPAPVGVAAALPSCSQFLDSEAFFPEDGVQLDDGDFSFTWDWLGDPPEGQILWNVELQGPGGFESSEVTDAMNLPFSTFTLSPNPGSRFFWRLSGLTQTSATVAGEPFCAPTAWRMFQIGPLPPVLAPPWTLETPETPDTPTVTPTPTPTATPSPAVCIYTALQNANCRASDYV